MSQPPSGWGPPPAGFGGRPPQRFSGGMVALGAVAGVVATVGLPLLLGGLAGTLGPVAPVLGIGAVLSFFVPLVLGIVLAATDGPATRRGLGLGMVIGWGLTILLAGGLCIALLAGFGNA